MWPFLILSASVKGLSFHSTVTVAATAFFTATVTRTGLGFSI